MFTCQILGVNCLARSESEIKHFSLLTFNQEAKIFLFFFFFFNVDLFAGSSLLHGLSLVAASEEYSLVPVCGLRVVVATSSRVQAQWFWFTGLVAPQQVRSSRITDQIRVPPIGRWILNHWKTREVSAAFERVGNLIECTTAIKLACL